MSAREEKRSRITYQVSILLKMRLSSAGLSSSSSNPSTSDPRSSSVASPCLTSAVVVVTSVSLRGTASSVTGMIDFIFVQMRPAQNPRPTLNTGWRGCCGGGSWWCVAKRGPPKGQRLSLASTVRPTDVVLCVCVCVCVLACAIADLQGWREEDTSRWASVVACAENEKQQRRTR